MQNSITWRRSFLHAIIVSACSCLYPAFSNAEIMTVADPDFPTSAPVLTVDPEGLGTAQRGVAADRLLRQTFQNPATFDVGEIVLSLRVDAGGENGGLDFSIFEVDDVNSNTWTPGSLVTSFSIPTTDAIPVTSGRLGLSLSGDHIFSLPARNSGTQGYGLEISNGDDATTVGLIRHTNDGNDNYASGKFYTESGGQSGNGTRDFGIAMIPVPEPTGTLLLLSGLVVLLRRRNRWQR